MTRTTLNVKSTKAKTSGTVPVSEPISSPIRMDFLMLLWEVCRANLQASSVNGGGDTDERWHWPSVLRIAGELQPRFFVLENPSALLTLQGGSAFLKILGGFTDLGYDVQWDVIPATAVGAGHQRERVWILASHTDCAGLQRHPGNEKKKRNTNPGRYPPEADLRSRKIDSKVWYRQSGIEPVVNGLSRRMVEDKLKAVGNSLVPQVAYIYMKSIADTFRMIR